MPYSLSCCRGVLTHWWTCIFVQRHQDQKICILLCTTDPRLHENFSIWYNTLSFYAISLLNGTWKCWITKSLRNLPHNNSSITACSVRTAVAWEQFCWHSLQGTTFRTLFLHLSFSRASQELSFLGYTQELNQLFGTLASCNKKNPKAPQDIYNTIVGRAIIIRSFVFL